MVADLLASCGLMWTAHFPGCNKRAHWHLANLFKFEAPFGLPFARLEGYLKYCIGSDGATAKARLDEFYLMQFVDYHDDNLSAKTPIVPTAKFFQVFDEYYLNVASSLIDRASATPLSEGLLNAKMQHVIYEMMQSLNRHIRCGTDDYIFSRLKPNIDLVIRVQLSMLRRGHWTIFMSVWLHDAHDQENSTISFNKILAAVFSRNLEESPETIDNYVTDLVSWGFLSRIGRSTYALHIDARKHFTDVFSSASYIAQEAVARLRASRPGEVIALRPGARLEQR